MKLSRFLISLLTLFAFSTNYALALPPGAGPTDGQENRAAEYVLRKFAGERLIPVRLLGGVRSPGTYFVPVGTDMLTVISLAGGINSTADSSDIQYRQWGAKKTRVFDLEDMMEEPIKLNPSLEANDILFVSEQKPWISQNALTVITVIATLLSMTTTVLVLRKSDL